MYNSSYCHICDISIQLPCLRFQDITKRMPSYLVLALKCGKALKKHHTSDLQQQLLDPLSLEAISCAHRNVAESNLSHLPDPTSSEMREVCQLVSHENQANSIALVKFYIVPLCGPQWTTRTTLFTTMMSSEAA